MSLKGPKRRAVRAKEWTNLCCTRCGLNIAVEEAEETLGLPVKNLQDLWPCAAVLLLRKTRFSGARG